MKTKILLAILALLLCVGSVGAVASVSESFQGWGSNNFGWYLSNVYLFNTTTGEVVLDLTSASQLSYVINENAYTFIYAGWDLPSGQTPYADCNIYLYNNNMNLLQITSTDSTWGTSGFGRYEINIVNSIPHYYCNGVLKATGAALSTNPSYLKIVARHYTPTYIDNIVLGSTDPHVVGVIPTNWTVINDLLNSANNGVYAWNNATQAWVVESNYYFYIDADTSSQAGFTNENFIILSPSLSVVNTTVIHSSTSQQNTIQYSVSQFLTAVGGQTGMYTAEFNNYPSSAATFWVVSQGAEINWSAATYPQNVNAGITYAISSSYYQTSTYTYSINVVNTAGTVLNTYALNSQTGTETVSITPATYTPGVYYCELVATPIGGGTASIMDYAAMQVTSYVYITGYVNAAQTALPLSGATVNASQLGVYSAVTSGATGAYSIPTNFLSGSAISVVTNLTGYITDTETFTPLGSANAVLNVSLLTTTPTKTGAAIGGVVRDSTYSNPIPSALVSVYNISTGESYSSTTNNAGFYQVNSLVNGRLYNVSATKTGYGATAISQVTAAGT